LKLSPYGYNNTIVRIIFQLRNRGKKSRLSLDRNKHGKYDITKKLPSFPIQSLKLAVKFWKKLSNARNAKKPIVFRKRVKFSKKRKSSASDFVH